MAPIHRVLPVIPPRRLPATGERYGDPCLSISFSTVGAIPGIRLVNKQVGQIFANIIQAGSYGIIFDVETFNIIYPQ